MSQVLKWLAGGDLRSDGLANEAADFVSEHPEAFEDLLAGLSAPEAVVRGRSADALEKVARAHPRWLAEHLPALIHIGTTDGVPMVRMHLAMLLGHLALFEAHADDIVSALLRLLEDESVFVRSWAIASLCIMARHYSAHLPHILKRIAPHQQSDSAAIRTRVRKALTLLSDDRRPFPKGWIKSEHLRFLESGRPIGAQGRKAK